MEHPDSRTTCFQSEWPKVFPGQILVLQMAGSLLQHLSQAALMDLSNIYVHDAQLYRVIEDIQANTLTMEVDLPILERDEEQEPRLLIFDDAFNYQVFEQAWSGLVTILDMHVVGAAPSLPNPTQRKAYFLLIYRA